jgi:hypothetical protein
VSRFLRACERADDACESRGVWSLKRTVRWVAGAHLPVPTPLAAHLPHVGRARVAVDFFGALIPAETPTCATPFVASAECARITRDGRRTHRNGVATGEECSGRSPSQRRGRPCAVGVASGTLRARSHPWCGVAGCPRSKQPRGGLFRHVFSKPFQCTVCMGSSLHTGVKGRTWPPACGSSRIPACSSRSPLASASARSCAGWSQPPSPSLRL